MWNIIWTPNPYLQRTKLHILIGDFHYQPSYTKGVQYIPRNMHTVFALLCFVVVIHWLIFPYSLGLLHWHCGNLTIAPVPAKQPWWIWINTSCEFTMNDCITTTKQSTTKPCAYVLGYTVNSKPLEVDANKNITTITQNTTKWFPYSMWRPTLVTLSMLTNLRVVHA